MRKKKRESKKMIEKRTKIKRKEIVVIRDKKIKGDKEEWVVIIKNEKIIFIDN